MIFGVLQRDQRRYDGRGIAKTVPFQKNNFHKNPHTADSPGIRACLKSAVIFSLIPRVQVKIKIYDKYFIIDFNRCLYNM